MAHNSTHVDESKMMTVHNNQNNAIITPSHDKEVVDNKNHVCVRRRGRIRQTSSSWYHSCCFLSSLAWCIITTMSSTIVTVEALDSNNDNNMLPSSSLYVSASYPYQMHNNKYNDDHATTTMVMTQPQRWLQTILPPADPSCAANPGCVELLGNCCPTDTGMTLECCMVTNPPSANPTDTPTKSPTDPPTLPPTTPRPTLAPTLKPTLSPTTMQPTTQRPTQIPTLNPTTQIPTGMPTTATPSSAPSQSPTTLQPTSAPTDSVSTLSPTTLSPTASPTTTDPPTPSPSAFSSTTTTPVPASSYQFDVVKYPANGVRMNARLNSRRRMLRDNTSNCTESWRIDLQNRIDKEIRTIVSDLETLQVNVFNASTYIGTDLLVILFNVLVELRSPPFPNNNNSSTNIIMDRFIRGPFDTADEERAYISLLRSTGCPQFVNVTGVDFVVPQENEQKSSSSDSVFSTGLVSALAAAVGVIIIVGGTMLFIRARSKSPPDLKDYSSDDERVFSQYNGNGEYTGSEIGGGGGHEYASEIGVRTSSNPDVSTLGDPIPYGAERARDDLSSIGSTSLEYDYKKAFADVQSCTNSYVAESAATTNEGLSTAVNSLLDDPSLASRSHIISLPRDDDDALGELYAAEETYEVLAPPGLLGLVLQSNVEDGRPTVHSIKPRSVLADVVRVGDRLVAVDDEDVTIMRASDVSQLIAEKKDHDVRRLVFSRPR